MVRERDRWLVVRMSALEELIDVKTENQGSIVLFRPLTERAWDWFSDFVDADWWQWSDGMLAVDHRLADDLRARLEEDGHVVERSR